MENVKQIADFAMVADRMPGAVVELRQLEVFALIWNVVRSGGEENWVASS
jgi:hypothetical protein